MSVDSPISPCRLTRGSYTSYFTLQISNKTARFLRDLHRARGRSRATSAPRVARTRERAARVDARRRIGARERASDGARRRARAKTRRESRRRERRGGIRAHIREHSVVDCRDVRHDAVHRCERRARGGGDGSRGKGEREFCDGRAVDDGAGDDDATGRGEGGRRGAIAFGRDVYAKRESSASAHGWAHDDLYVDQ